MLWTVLKVAAFFVLVLALAFGSAFLMEQDGMIRLAAFGTEFSLSPLAAVLAFLAALGVLWLMLKALGLLLAVLRFVNGDETAVSRFFNRNRERSGYQALADAITALASGEPRQALRMAAKAERKLRQPALTLLVTAQAAEAAGDRAQAIEVYKRLVRDQRTRFVGVRGLMRQKLAEGDTETAFRLAEKAFALKPRHREVQDTLMRLQSDRADWAGARATLAQQLRSQALPRDVHSRRDAVLALAEAEALLASGDVQGGTALVAQANRLSPELVPAAARLARLKAEAGERRAAEKVVRRAWAAAPHPDLAAAFAAIVPDETPQARIKRFRVLTAQHADHPETRMLEAELALAAEDFPAARRSLGDLAESHPSQRAFALLAAIARGEGASEALVRGWLARALAAPRGPQWLCTSCNHIHAGWVPVCENCGALDTLAWREPPESAQPALPGAEMLPLIVGGGPPDAEDEDAAAESIATGVEEDGTRDEAEDRAGGATVTPLRPTG